MNTVNLIGRVASTPELRYTPNGLAVTTFRVAVPRDFKNVGGERATDFFSIVAWRHTAEYAVAYLPMGRQISVEGNLQQRGWTDQTGVKHSVVEVVAHHLQGLGKAPQAETDAQAPAYSEEEQSLAEAMEV